jgi:cardiolipin synthase C
VTAIITHDTRSYRRRSALLSLIAIAPLHSGCAQLQARPELPIESALSIQDLTYLDRLFAPQESDHPNQSGFRLVREGPEAFVTRIASARHAGRSLDVQTYIWHDDTTGLYLVKELLAAADRGVRVRLLVDDMDARAKNLGFAGLAAHSNIAVRLFNPFASRRGKLAFLSEGLRSFDRVNHRMHNKTWIADNRFAITGGRNLGDEYFGASDAVNFVDLDFAMVGPIVRDASASFDGYWNSAAAYSMEILDPEHVTPSALEELRIRLPEKIDEKRAQAYKGALANDDAIRRLHSGDWPLHWTQTFQFIADDPAKITMADGDMNRSNVLPALLPLFQHAIADLTVLSPYFVPGEGGTALLTTAAQRGARVRVLTNSLVANDVAAVHGGYSRSRPALLEGGVQLWELKPTGDDVAHGLFGSSGASLHTKALAVDSRLAFVGSYNLDPRSTWLNCEQGVLVEHVAVARELEEIFSEQTTGARAWKVSLQNEAVSWSDGTQTFDSEPKASWGRRFVAWIARVFHLDAQL